MEQEAFDSSPVAQALFDAHGRTLRVNLAFRRMFGDPPLADVLTVLRAASEGLGRLVLALVESGADFDVPDLKVRLPSDKSRRMSAHGARLRAGSLLTLTDHTDRVLSDMAQAQQTRAEALARLSSGLSHDLGNILAGVIATAQAALMDFEEGTHQVDVDLRRIMAEAERGADLARSLRALAFDETGSWGPVALGPEIRAAAELLARGRAPHLVMRIDADVPAVIGDRARLHQLVLNLLVNACDAAGANGVVDVWLSRMDDGVRLRVDDTGPGVHPELLERIFEPYFSTKQDGRDSAQPGRGLGLTVVDAVARATGGRVAVGRSSSGGARFDVFWPSNSVNQAEPAPTPATGPRWGVLVVGSDTRFLSTIARHLRRRGHGTFAALSRPEAIDLLARYSRQVQVVVVALGAEDDPSEQEATYRAGDSPPGVVLLAPEHTVLAASRGSLLVPRPFELDALVTAIGQAAERRRPAS